MPARRRAAVVSSAFFLFALFSLLVSCVNDVDTDVRLCPGMSKSSMLTRLLFASFIVLQALTSWVLMSPKVSDALSKVRFSFYILYDVLRWTVRFFLMCS